jgi:hypothetical protein
LPLVVIAGLDPAIHRFRMMDHRVSRFARPGDDRQRAINLSYDMAARCERRMTVKKGLY